MQLNFLNIASKSARQPKLTNRAKAALNDEAENVAKKRKADGSHSLAGTAVIKKAKAARSTGDGKNSSASMHMVPQSTPRLTHHETATTEDVEAPMSEEDDVQIVDSAENSPAAHIETADDELSEF